MNISPHVLEIILSKLTYNIYDLAISSSERYANNMTITLTFTNKFKTPNYIIDTIKMVRPYNIFNDEQIAFETDLKNNCLGNIILFANNVIMLQCFSNTELYFDGNSVYYTLFTGINRLCISTDAKQGLMKFFNTSFCCDVCNEYLNFKIINNIIEIDNYFKCYSRCPNKHYNTVSHYSAHGDMRIIHTNCASKTSCHKCGVIVCNGCQIKIRGFDYKEMLSCGAYTCMI
jgi:hypothetical protein